MNRILTSKTTCVKSEFPYRKKTDKGVNYLWQLLNPELIEGVLNGFDVTKNGFAKRVYRGGFDGVENRIKNTFFYRSKKKSKTNFFWKRFRRH